MFKSAHGVIAALNERLARPRRKSRRKHAARPRPFAGAIESLEDRRLLAVITVTSLLDTVQDRDEALTLREAILIANDSTGATSFEGISSTDVADTIVFDPNVFVSDSGPIFLSQQLPVVTELLTIDGEVDTQRVAIDGMNESRILENASAGLNLRNLILQNGFVFGDGGAILNNRDAVLDLNNVDIIDSTAALGISSFTVGALSAPGGCGGGIYNVTGATVTITDSTITGNTAEANGGGLFNEVGGTATITSAVLSGNSASVGGGFQNNGAATITGSAITSNTAKIDGGGVYNDGDLVIDASAGGVQIAQNVAHAHSFGHGGGGIFNSGILVIEGAQVLSNNGWANGGGILNEQGILTVIGSILTGNRSTQGGGLHNAGTATLTASTVTENRAYFGGGVSNGRIATLVVDQTVISLNVAVVDGGGIYNLDDLAVTGGVFEGNEAAHSGGALFNAGDAAIIEATIRDNSADSDGGGIWSLGHLTIADSTISGNTAGSNGGGLLNSGGVWNGRTATLVLDQTVISSNIALADGGGIANFNELTVTGGVFAGNQAASGGALFNGGDATITGATIRNNHAEFDGGGISNIENLTIVDSTINGNTAGSDGGGIKNSRVDGEAGTLILQNSTISGNTAVNGGGIFVRGSTFLRSVTVASNSASQSGGGVFVGAALFEPISTIIADNTASFAPDLAGSVAAVLGFNLIEDTTGTIFIGVPPSSATITGVDPRLGPLQDNGGPTFTHALLPGSPAIDKGSNPTEAPFDQRGPGFGRTRGRQTDIGAFEVQSLPAPGLIVVGSGLGAAPEIRIFDPETNQLIGSFAPFPSFFRGGIRVATGDVNGDGVPDIVASAAPKGPPRVRVFDGTDLTGGTVLMDFFAYHAGFGGGVFVATGDVNNDGRADIITGAGAGGGPIAKVFSGADLSGGTVLMSFFPYHRGFRGGVQVAAGDINGDNRDDVITGAGPGGGPIAKVFSGADLSGGTVLMSFFPYHRGFRGGVQVAAGDINGDGRDDVITGAGFGGGPRVKVFSGADLSAGTLLADLFAYGQSFRGGVRVASADVNGDGVDDIITGPGPLGGSHVRAFHGMTGERLETFFAAPRGSTRGVFVAGVSRNAAEPPPSSVPSSGGSGGSSVSFQLIDDLFSDTLVLDELLALNPSLQEHRPTVATL